MASSSLRWVAARAIVLAKSGALFPISLRCWASPLTAVASPPAPARTPRLAVVQSLGAPPPKKAKAVPAPAPGLDMPGGSQERRGGGDSPLRARLPRWSLPSRRGCHRRAKRPSLRPLLQAVVAKAPSPQSKLTWHGPP